MEKRRIDYIDVAKGIGMILVIIGHVNIAYDFANPGNGVRLVPAALDSVISSFHMPLFFFVAGMTVSRPMQTRHEYKDLCIRRTRQLLVPYALWALIFTTALSPDKFLQTILYILYGNNKTLSMVETNAVLWFLTAMFTATLLFHGVLLVCGRLRSGARRTTIEIGVFVAFALASWLLAVPNSTYGYPFEFDVALSGAAFMAMGYASKNLIGRLLEKFGKGKALLLAAAALVLCTAAALFNNQYIANDKLGKVVMAWGNYGIYPLFVLTAVLGTATVLGLSYSLAKSRVLQFFGRNTLLILSIHYSFMVLAAKLLPMLGLDFTSGVSRTLAAALLFAAGAAGSAVVTPFIAYFFPNLCGKK